ncbi:MAG: hypothetical protein Q8Q46_00970, partial [Candidatus Giovannonibacteria bacterium]|nr:hypothetical protein [Candidatus Giovannonibacteria bacterium]
AKIIFGAIQDERLKKGDIKITVIASGFPDDHIGKSATLFSPAIAQKNNPVSANPAGKSSGVQVQNKNNSDESEWDSIPAFIRRQRK